MKNKKTKNEGFTLVELLVVMAIIALLAGLSLFALQGARSQGRDAKRKSDLETIRSALEIYKADCNVYPASIPNPGNKITGTCTGSTNTYLEDTPGDPSTGNKYPYSSSGTTYRL